MLPTVRYGLRALRRGPVLPSLVMLLLAIGIGANTLMFMVLDRTVLRPVPFPTEGLVILWESLSDQGVEKSAASLANFLDWRRGASSFRAMTAVERSAVSVRTRDGKIQVSGAWVDPAFFTVVSLRPVIGRLPSPDAVQHGDRLVVLAEGLWRRWFAGDPGIVGRPLVVDGEPHTVAAIVRRGEELPRGAELWIPRTLAPDPGPRGNRSYIVIAALRTGSRVAQAQAEMSAIAARLAQEYPDTNAGADVVVAPLRRELGGVLAQHIVLVFGAFGLALLVVCINVANLFVARVEARRREFAIGMVLGAGRGSIAGAVLTEVAALVLAGGAVGLGLAAFGRRVLEIFGVLRTLGIAELPLDLRVAGFTLLASGLACFLVALLPLAGILRRRPSLRTEDLGGFGPASRPSRAQGVLVALQVALSLPLLVATFILGGNLAHLRALDMGFDPTGVETLKISVVDESNPKRSGVLVAEALARVESLPSVTAAAAVSDLPFAGAGTRGSFHIVGRAVDERDPPFSDLRVTTPRFFELMRISMRSGRPFRQSDTAGEPPVAIVNESLARQYWPGVSPLGQRVRIGGPEEVRLYGGGVEREVVGVVADFVGGDLEGGITPALFVPYAQYPVASLAVVLSAKVTPSETGLRTLLEGGGSFLAGKEQPLAAVLSASLGYPEIQVALLVGLCLIAAALLATSVHAVIAKFLESRRAELAIRAAFGAGSARLVGHVLRQGAGWVLAGLGGGLLASAGLVKMSAHYVHFLAPAGAFPWIWSLTIVVAMAFLACAGPLGRVLSMPPSAVLRHD